MQNMPRMQNSAPGTPSMTPAGYQGGYQGAASYPTKSPYPGGVVPTGMLGPSGPATAPTGDFAPRPVMGSTASVLQCPTELHNELLKPNAQPSSRKALVLEIVSSFRTESVQSRSDAVLRPGRARTECHVANRSFLWAAGFVQATIDAQIYDCSE